ncbi:hypothetical protein CMUS01_02562 [Colletotrichum musicola]|uniref:Uncharacterized protein n=1 Tax=Colletotrichum musicola TaxID=2175873 RepID=A0A8H6U6Y4_9PEZI|nr:hypothetical protein CMUS01_02562 [Colletotrichum musicola]
MDTNRHRCFSAVNDKTPWIRTPYLRGRGHLASVSTAGFENRHAWGDTLAMAAGGGTAVGLFSGLCLAVRSDLAPLCALAEFAAVVTEHWPGMKGRERQPKTTPIRHPLPIAWPEGPSAKPPAAAGPRGQQHLEFRPPPPPRTAGLLTGSGFPAPCSFASQRSRFDVLQHLGSRPRSKAGRNSPRQSCNHVVRLLPLRRRGRNTRQRPETFGKLLYRAEVAKGHQQALNPPRHVSKCPHPRNCSLVRRPTRSPYGATSALRTVENEALKPLESARTGPL